MTTPVSVIPAIETTVSMANSGFAVAAQIAGGAFVGDLLANDSLCLVSVGASGAVAWPATGGLIAVDNTMSQLTQAQAAIDALTFTDATANLAGGLSAAYAALGASPPANSNGVVLIATGNNTTGADPLKLATYYPTHSCALGPSANITLLHQISTLSGGTYYYVPTEADMATILNQIRGRRPGWSTLFNQATTVQPRDYWLPQVSVAAGQARVQFSIVWENAALAWTGSANPGPNEISVTVVKPPGIVLAAASVSGNGFCVYDIAAPPAGVWYIQVMYPGSAALAMTGAAFSVPTSSSSLPQLRLSPDQDGMGGVAGQMTVEGVAHISPLVVETVRHDPAQGHVREVRVIAAAADGSFRIPAPAAGSFNCSVRASGTLAGTGSPFEFTEMISIHDPLHG